MGNKKFQLVCVDDQEGLLDQYEMIFEDFQEVEIVTFQSSQTAVDYINEHSQNIAGMILDYQIDDYNGFDVRRLTFKNSKDVPAILVTGFYTKEMAMSGMELQILKFFEKPFDSDELVDFFTEQMKNRIESLEEEREMISSFIEETYPMLEEIEELILALEESPDDINLLNTYFRLLHTIKGTSSCVGLKSMPEYAHKYEDLINAIKDNGILVTKEIIDVLLIGLDDLKQMFSDIENCVRFEFDISEKVKVFDIDLNQSQEINTHDEGKAATAKNDQHTGQKKSQDDEKLTVRTGTLDEFMELSGELTVLRNAVTKNVLKLEQVYREDSEVSQLSENLEEMHKISSMLQNKISDMRKVPLEQVFRPLKRTVRDVTKNLGKEVLFDVKGEAIKVDTLLAKVLSNILVHMVRNAIDHGIEMPDKREELGKGGEGHVTLSAVEEGDYIRIDLQDDGAGINIDRLKAKAIESGIHTVEELEKMSKQRLYHLIFGSGVSTAEKVTDISGRGVGMDMVKSTIEENGGKILIDSELGNGTNFQVLIPIPKSVLIISALLIESGGDRYFISTDNVSEVINISEKRRKEVLREVEGEFFLINHQGLLPIIDLKETLTSQNETNEFSNIVVLKGDGYCFALAVDEIGDIEEVVVKKVNESINSKKLFMGATFASEGEVALILDTEGIGRFNSIKVDESEDGYLNGDSTVGDSKIDEFMKFSLSGGNSYAIALAHVQRIERFKLSMIEKSGDLDLIRYRDEYLRVVSLKKMLGIPENENSHPEEVFETLIVEYQDSIWGLRIDEIEDIGVTMEDIDTSLASEQHGILGTVFIDGKVISVIDFHKHIQAACGKKRESHVPDLSEERGAA